MPKLFGRQTHNAGENFATATDVPIADFIRYPLKAVVASLQQVTAFLYSQSLQVLIGLEPGRIDKTPQESALGQKRNVVIDHGEASLVRCRVQR
jgi:hypothetical protein